MEIKLTRLMYGWSKYGGARHGLEKEHLQEWYCQSCGEKQTLSLPSYMFTLEDCDDRNFFRVCSVCKHKALLEKIKTLGELISKVRNELQTPSEDE